MNDDERADAEIKIAQVCWEADRALRTTQGEDPLPPWSAATSDVRYPMLLGVRKVLAGHTPEELHERWVSQRALEGWTYGEVEDADAKVSDLMVDYTMLPQEQKARDALVVAIVQGLAGPMGLA